MDEDASLQDEEMPDSDSDGGPPAAPRTAYFASDQAQPVVASPAPPNLDGEAEQARAQRAAAAKAAQERFSAAASQGVLPTKEEMAERAQLAEARDKLVKLIVSSIMNYRVNSIPAAAACLHVLSTLVYNVLGHPLDPKMRQVKVASKAFSTRVTAVTGGEAFLREAGWRKRTSDFVGTYNFEHQPGTLQWQVLRDMEVPPVRIPNVSTIASYSPKPCILKMAGTELTKACTMADDKAGRAAADAVAASKRKAGDDREREKIKLHVKGDREERKDRFVYQ